MTWAEVLLALLQLANHVFTLASEKRAEGVGAATAIGQAAQECLNDLREVRKVRAKADSDFDAARHTGGMPADVQYRD